MKRIFSQLVVYLLYLTPIGYLLSLFKLNSGDTTPGVYIDLPRDRPINVTVKQNPLYSDRFHWFFNGAVLLGQAFVVVNRNVGGNWGTAYAWIAIVFGIVNVTASLCPTIDWALKFPRFVLWLVIISSLIFAVVFNDLKLFLK